MCCSTVDLCSFARQADLLRLAQYAMQTPSRRSSPPVKICIYPSAVAMRQRALRYHLTNDVPLATRSLVVVACCCATNAHRTAVAALHAVGQCRPTQHPPPTVYLQHQSARKPEQYGVNFPLSTFPSPNWPKPNVGVVCLRKNKSHTVFLL